MAKLTVKATLNNTTRRFPIDDTVTFLAFQAQLKTLFATTEPFVLTYEDSDKDVITVSSDIELGELFTSVKDQSLQVARIHLTPAGKPIVAADAFRALNTLQTTSSTSGNAAEVAQLNSLVSGVSELLSAVKASDFVAMDTTKTVPPQPAATEPQAARGLGGASVAPMTGEAQGAAPPRKGIFSGLRPYMSAFPSGKGGLKKNLKAVSPECKAAFKKLVRYIAKAENTLQIVGALKEAFPVLRKWIVEELGDEGLPDPQKVDRLVAAGEAVLLPKAGEEATKCVIEFVRVAVADKAIVNILREVNGMGPMPWEAGFQPVLKKGKKSKRATGPQTEGAQPSASRGLGTADGAAKADDAEGAAPPRKGIFAGLRPYISAFPAGKPGFRKSVKTVSPESKAAFKEVVRYISKSEKRSDIVGALKEAFPILRKWMSEELADEGLPEAEKVNAVVAAVEASLLPKVGTEATKHVTDFMCIALADEGIVGILRKVRGMGAMPWEEGFKLSVPSLRKGPRGFDVHNGTRCSSCKADPIVGSRFKCTNRKNFNLCSKCYDDGEVAKEEMQFKECKFIWESIVADTKVPPAPLKAGDRGPKVKFLHKVLTDLGFMNEGMYAKRMGFYGPQTKAAVQQFQREKVIGAICEDGVYDSATAECLGDVVEGRDVEMAGSAAVGGVSGGSLEAAAMQG